ncbi:P-type conjugative transfer protein TrbL [Caulobacter flavus]|uniref:P-type conjugative transfer protein TrbL n=1 Tax=Caulobacter flavus TaxID=1679497 RepID=A0A2N5CP89_9CAUL|nr:P-type conjugative transfer protein TrbL [Caulobacter flavus]AYV48520.1 P-type conjugative transfer protein TrbL [Caulobacter flavus]PLR08765.1 P-type conjugative transfer protein TrbL [Caulobacter flavus]
MNDTGFVDTFFDTFSNYIDSGFGLLGPHVGALANLLLAIDVTLAALMWSLASGEDVLARLIRKVIYVGFFAYLIGNFQALSTIVLTSFTKLGLTAAGAGVSAEEMLRPGKLAALGVSAGKPLLEAAADLSGWPGVFENLVQIVVLLLAFVLVIVAFFIVAVQVFVVLIEFKLATLMGFVLVPFGLFGRTAFLAEKVLGEVLATGVKVMALAAVVGIGATIFQQMTATWTYGQPTLDQLLALILASMVLLGLSIFCPAMASGLISGAPQLGAGAAVGTGLTVGGMAVAGVAAAQMATGAGAGLAARAAMAGGAGGSAGGMGGPSPTPPPGPSGSPSSPSSPSSPPSGSAAATPGASGGSSSAAGGQGGSGGGGAPTAPASAPGLGASADEAPQWARDLKKRQDLAHGASLVAHGLASGDDHSAGASPSLSET